MQLHQHAGILEHVSGEHRNHGVTCTDDTVPHQLAHAGHTGCAGRLAANAGPIDRHLGVDDLVVGGRNHQAVGLANRAYGAIPRRRVTDANGRRNRFRLHRVAGRELLAEGPRERRRAGGLHAHEARHLRDEPERLCFPQRLPKRRGVAQVARRQHDEVGRVPSELL